MRVLAYLLTEEGVAPDAIERAVTSALNMKLGESASLTGLPETEIDTLRRVFVMEQVARIGEKP